MQWWKDFKATTSTKFAQFNNSTFKNAAMGTCALIAAADGKVDPSEKSKVVKLIANNEMLSVFNAAEMGSQFSAYCDKAGDDFGRLDVLNVVRKLKGNEAQADTAIKIALIIANADGNFDESEQKVVKEICGVLGVSADGYL